jgi:hypothetical protein
MRATGEKRRTSGEAQKKHWDVDIFSVVPHADDPSPPYHYSVAENVLKNKWAMINVDHERTYELTLTSTMALKRGDHLRTEDCTGVEPERTAESMYRSILCATPATEYAQ